MFDSVDAEFTQTIDGFGAGTEFFIEPARLAHEPPAKDFDIRGELTERYVRCRPENHDGRCAGGSGNVRKPAVVACDYACRGKQFCGLSQRQLVYE